MVTLNFNRAPRMVDAAGKAWASKGQRPSLRVQG
jgi:hypothetical protein